jgi:hypothetical protein
MGGEVDGRRRWCGLRMPASARPDRWWCCQPTRWQRGGVRGGAGKGTRRNGCEMERQRGKRPGRPRTTSVADGWQSLGKREDGVRAARFRGDDSTKQTTGKGLRRSTARWGQLAAACARTRARASTWLYVRCGQPARRGAREEHRRRVHSGSWVHSGDSQDVCTPEARGDATWMRRYGRVHARRCRSATSSSLFIS